MWKLSRIENTPIWYFHHLDLTAIATKIWDSCVRHRHCSLHLETCVTHKAQIPPIFP